MRTKRLGVKGAEDTYLLVEGERYDLRWIDILDGWIRLRFGEHVYPHCGDGISAELHLAGEVQNLDFDGHYQTVDSFKGDFYVPIPDYTKGKLRATIELPRLRIK